MIGAAGPVEMKAYPTGRASVPGYGVDRTVENLEQTAMAIAVPEVAVSSCC